MSTNAISGSGTAGINLFGQTAQSGGTGSGGSFADILAAANGAQNALSLLGATTGQTGLSVTGGVMAHLPNGIGVGVFSFRPVDSAAEAQMAASVADMVSSFENISIPTTQSDAAESSSGSSSSANAGAGSASGLSGLTGIDVTLPSGIELMTYSAGTDKGGPSLQDMTAAMNQMVSTVEKNEGLTSTDQASA